MPSDLAEVVAVWHRLPLIARDEPFPAAATRMRALPPPIKIPPQTDSLTEMKAFSTVVPRRGGGPFSKTLFEERTSESAKHQKASSRFCTARSD